MRFGVSKETITPCFPMQTACTGRYTENFKGVHDDVFCRCLVLDDDKEKLILMSYDLLFHDRELNHALEVYAQQTYGVNPSSLVLSYTHSHTAPACRGYNRGHHSDRYEDYLLEKGKLCMDKAMYSMTEGTMEYGSAEIFRNCSRRGYVNGVPENAPNPGRERDTQLFVLCLRDLKQNIRSILVNYACHPVFYPVRDSLSAEFPGRLCQLLDTEYFGCTSLFMQSAAGDVRPMLTLDPTPAEDGSYHWFWNEMNFSHVDQMAKGLQADVNALLGSENMKQTEPDFASDSFVLDLPMEPKPLEYFTESVSYYCSPEGNPNQEHAAYISAGAYDTMPKSLPLHCQTLRISKDLYLATVGGEPCFPVKQMVQTVFEGLDLCFVGYTDACAYVVDDTMLEEGGYEPNAHLEYGLIGPFVKGLDEKYIQGFKASLDRLKQTTIFSGGVL